MANDERGLTVQEQKKREELVLNQKIMSLGSTLEKRSTELSHLLGDNCSPERFVQIAKTAIMKTPALANCDPKSFFEACLLCATDGLVPDGKRAALVPFGANVTYIPMTKGIVECLHRTGLVKDIQVDVVYRGEHFVNTQGSDSVLEHAPSLDRDASRKNDQNIIGAYAIIKTVNGGVYKKAIGRSYIDKVKNSSRASGKGPWVDWFAAMAEKTALRSLSKLLPVDLDMDVLRRDDQLYDMSKSQHVSVSKTVQLQANPDDNLIPQGEAEEKINGEVANPKKQEQRTQQKAAQNNAPIEGQVIERGEIDEDGNEDRLSPFFDWLRAEVVKRAGWNDIEILHTKISNQNKDLVDEAINSDRCSEFYSIFKNTKWFDEAPNDSPLRSKILREVV